MLSKYSRVQVETRTDAWVVFFLSFKISKAKFSTPNGSNAPLNKYTVLYILLVEVSINLNFARLSVFFSFGFEYLRFLFDF